MNITTKNNSPQPYEKQQSVDDNRNFNDLVLAHIKNNRPDGSLDQLLNEMKKLLPDMPVSMQKLNSALLYSDMTLRIDPDYEDYTTEVLDNRTSQLLGLNMLTNIMLNNILRHNNEDEDKYLI